MQIIDVQRHEPEPWLDGWEELEEQALFRLFTEMTLASMDAAGVDIAVINPTGIGNEGRDWMWYAVSNVPERFVADPGCPARAEDLDEQLAGLAENKTVVCCRSGFGPNTETATELLESGAYDALFRGAERHGLPLLLYPGKPYPDGFLRLVAAVARRAPNVRFAVDHVGLPQPPVDEADSPPLKRLPQVLDLARYSNVSVKFTSAPTLSLEPYPFNDLVDGLLRMVEAFGPERVMWGSDITRVVGRQGVRGTKFYRTRGVVPDDLGEEGRRFWQYAGPLYEIMWERAEAGYVGKHTYGEAVGYIRDTSRLSQEDKALILGGSFRRFFARWPQERAS